MKIRPTAIGMFVLVLFGMLASGTAMAQHRGHGHGHGHGGNARFGISVALPLFAAAYYPLHHYAYPAYVHPLPVYRYPAAVMVASSPPVYIERDAAPAPPTAAQTQADWYYCAAANAYYPYVAECPAGWQRVPARPHSR